MKTISSVKEMQAYALRQQMKGRSIGFVPTMGALHEGHLSLVRRARRENDEVIVSVFVNPTQFGPKEDFKKYPRALNADRALLNKESIDVLFTPSIGEMYPQGYATHVSVCALTQTLCGPLRPGHFKGVATIVAKLLQIAQPSRAYFGQKDYQQLQVIRRLASDLNMPVKVIGCETVREHDGLAASSRNRYLSAKERDEAVLLYQMLYLGRELIEQKIMLEPKRLEKRLRVVLSTVPKCKVDYISAVDPETLQPMKHIKRPVLLAAAIWIGKTRLIDNIFIP